MLVSCKKCSVRVHASEYLSPPLTGSFLKLQVVTEWPSQSPAAKDAYVFLGSWWLVDELPCGSSIHPSACQLEVSWVVGF